MFIAVLLLDSGAREQVTSDCTCYKEAKQEFKTVLQELIVDHGGGLIETITEL